MTGGRMLAVLEDIFHPFNETTHKQFGNFHNWILPMSCAFDKRTKENLDSPPAWWSPSF
jgi:hypothetical protein